MVSSGFPQNRSDVTKPLLQFHKLRNELSTLGPVVMLNKRPVIPKSLRNDSMDCLHVCHSGANGMIQRAFQSVYWPNYRRDISAFQAACKTCRLIEPSKHTNPQSDHVDLPSYPFQVICADFFVHNGKNYLIIVDKYSNWLSILKLKRDDSSNVIAVLRQYFVVFGICEIIATDGALQFTSQEM